MSTPADDAVAKAMWSEVASDFGSDDAHHKLVNHFGARGDLGEAASLYRQHRETLEDDDDETRARIDQRLSAITTLAMTQLDVTRTEPKPRSLAVTLLMVTAGLFCVAAVAGLFKALLP